MVYVPEGHPDVGGLLGAGDPAVVGRTVGRNVVDAIDGTERNRHTVGGHVGGVQTSVKRGRK